MRICVGKIIRPHGVAGAVVILPYTSSPTFFTNCTSSLFLESGEQLKIVRAFVNKNLVVAVIDSINSRNSAELLCGQKIYVDRESLPRLENDEFYFEDLKNLEVLGIMGNYLGKTVAVQDYGAGAFLEIEMPTQKIATLPFNSVAIVKVDLVNSKVLINEKLLLY